MNVPEDTAAQWAEAGQAFALTEWLTASRYPDLGGGLGEAPGDVAELLAMIKAFEADVRALAPNGF